MLTVSGKGTFMLRLFLHVSEILEDLNIANFFQARSRTPSLASCAVVDVDEQSCVLY